MKEFHNNEMMIKKQKTVLRRFFYVIKRDNNLSLPINLSLNSIPLEPSKHLFHKYLNKV